MALASIRPAQLPVAPAAPSRPLVLEDGRPTEQILAEQRTLMRDARYLVAKLYETFARLTPVMNQWTNNDFELVRRADEVQLPIPRPAVFSIPLAQANSQPQMQPGRMSLPNLPERAAPTAHPLWRERQP